MQTHDTYRSKANELIAEIELLVKHIVFVKTNGSPGSDYVDDLNALQSDYMTIYNVLCRPDLNLEKYESAYASIQNFGKLHSRTILKLNGEKVFIKGDDSNE